MYKRELYWQKIKPFIHIPVIKVLTGMRRVGKSTFMHLIMLELKEMGATDSQMVYVNKEDMAFDAIKNHRDLFQYITDHFKKIKGRKYILIDEIQEIENWEKAIASFAGKEEYDIYITGSNAHLLSSELATLISGRYVEFTIYPLTFKEYQEFRGDQFGAVTEEFQQYLRYGGLPVLFHLEKTDEVVFQYIKSIYDTVLLKDIVGRNNIRNISLLEKLSKFLFDNIGHLLSANNISKFLKSEKIKVYPDTIQNYLGYFTSAYIAHKVERFDIKGKKLLSINEKYYLNDIGLRHALLGYKPNDIGQLLENIVYLELRTRGYQVSVGVLGEHEIDFIATKNDEKIYIQVAYLLASEEIIKREFQSLQKINDNYPKIVLSMDDKLWGNDVEGIKRYNIIEFLLK